MAAATEAQVRALEKAHKTQLALIVAGNRFWYGLAKKFAAIPDHHDPRYVAMIDYGLKLSKIASKWIERQRRLEKAGVATIPVYTSDFFKPSKFDFLDYEVRKNDKEQNPGLGFIPLLIWAVISIIGFFTAEKIVDELNTTAEEKQELLDETAKKCKDLSLTEQDCNKLITDTQAQASAPGAGFEIAGAIKWGVIGLLLVGAFGAASKFSSKNK